MAIILVAVTSHSIPSETTSCSSTASAIVWGACIHSVGVASSAVAVVRSCTGGTSGHTRQALICSSVIADGAVAGVSSVSNTHLTAAETLSVGWS